jgi:predicted hotdog family 3-hydroxylacyl-ACP dehydratase
MIGSLVGPERIRGLVPHAGSMCLLHEVVHWDQASIRCLALSHRDPAHPLRRESGLAGLHLVEYCAQSLAVHRGLVSEAAGERAPPGWLVAVRDFKLLATRLDLLEGPLILSARELLYFEGGTQYEARAEADGKELGGGRISVVRVPQ